VPLGDRPTPVPDFEPEDFARDSEIKLSASLAVEGEPTIDQARRLHLDGDQEHALFLLTRLLELAPAHPEAATLAAECRVALEHQCLSAIGSEAALLVVAVSQEELKGFALDNVSGFLLSRLDGATSVEDLLDMAGPPRLVALCHLRNLFERGIITLGSGQKRIALPEHAGLWGRPEIRAPADDRTVESGVVPARMGAPTLDAVAVLLVAPEDVDTLVLDPEARVLVALVNDKATVAEILVATKTDLVEGTLLLERLAEDGIVSFV
jgi:hypothetical protein